MVPESPSAVISCPLTTSRVTLPVPIMKDYGFTAALRSARLWALRDSGRYAAKSRQHAREDSLHGTRSLSWDMAFWIAVGGSPRTFTNPEIATIVAASSTITVSQVPR
jgi:hypothetical protein